MIEKQNNMEYTGYKDIDNNKVYVGDVYKTKLCFKDDWESGVNYIKNKDNKILKIDEEERNNPSNNISYKRIGNLYTNPELVNKLNNWDRWEFTNPEGLDKTVKSIAKVIKGEDE